MANTRISRKQGQKPTATPSPPQPEQVSLKTWIGIFGAMLGAFVVVLDIQITNSSLEQISGALGATTEEGSWISTAYDCFYFIGIFLLVCGLALLFCKRLKSSNGAAAH